jgi:hypothetical protein
VAAGAQVMSFAGSHQPPRMGFSVFTRSIQGPLTGNVRFANGRFGYADPATLVTMRDSRVAARIEKRLEGKEYVRIYP